MLTVLSYKNFRQEKKFLSDKMAEKIDLASFLPSKYKNVVKRHPKKATNFGLKLSNGTILLRSFLTNLKKL